MGSSSIQRTIWSPLRRREIKNLKSMKHILKSKRKRKSPKKDGRSRKRSRTIGK